MLAGSRAQRAEAKYNVALEFPNYGLHAAAASGNLGLVKYALEHGQPVNSALDGLLPLHAACHGGSDLVVRLLIEHGADVNAQRLPRRYATEKHRASSPSLSIPGPSGSTPLHFASTNGHSVVVMTLLLHGASPDRPDKHGTTPEMVARQNGHTDCADVLREWCHNKDRDLRERDAVGTHLPGDSFSSQEKSHPYCGSLDCRECATRKRIKMKRSIDNAIHMLRHPSSQHSMMTTPPHSSASIQSATYQPPSPAEGKPLGEYTFYPNDAAMDDLPPRRPSLPQVLEVPRSSNSSQRSRRPSNMSTSSRPRSAGTDAEPTRVRGKLSLLNIFKKANEPGPELDSNSNISPAVASASVSPAPTSTLHMTPLSGHSSEGLIPGSSRTHHRLFSEGASSLSPTPLAEVNHAASRESLRERAATSRIGHDPLGKGSPPIRPGILRAHGRSTSSGQSTPQSDSTRSVPGTQSSVRALRFDSVPAGHASVPRRTNSHKRSARHESRSPTRHVQSRGSVNSFRSPSPGSSSFGLRMESEPEALTTSSILSERVQTNNIEEEDEDEDEDEYGHPVSPQVGVRELQTRLSNLDVDRRTDRRTSVQSTISEVDSQDTLHHVFQCPFSINQPPPEEETPPRDLHLLRRASMESRMRGNSMSSMITDTSAGPPSSFVPTPSIQQSTLPGPVFFAPSSVPTELSPFGTVDERGEMTVQVDEPSPVKRSHVPLGIDIRSISTHAQAEALVARAQRRVLDQSNDLDEQEIKTLGLNVGDGHTPLSARLAAYGESLVIEKKFKEAEEKKRRSLLVNSVSASTIVADRVSEPSVGDAARRSRLEPQMSLQERRRHSPSSPLVAELDRLSPPPTRNDALSISNPEHTGNLHHLLNLSSISNPPAVTSYSQLRADTLPVDRITPPRSRTPDPELYDHSTFGVPLVRHQTCPVEDSFDYASSTRKVKERQAARAQKLAKMGFSGSAEPWRETSAYASRPQRQRFGGIKTLVQSLTGKA